MNFDLIDTRKGRPFPNPCCLCGHVFDKTEKFGITEEKISWFRGDDIVKFYCYPACKAKPATIPE